MKIASFVFSTLFSFSAFANFDGTWKGQGHLIDGGGNMQVCNFVNFEITQSDTSFNMISGTFDCELFKMKWTPFALEIKDGELLNNGVVIGSISDDFLFARQQNTSNGLIGIYQAEIVGGGMNFKETVTDADGNIIFAVEADLIK